MKSLLITLVFFVTVCKAAEPAKTVDSVKPSPLTAEEKEKVSQAAIMFQMRDKALTDAIESHPDVVQAKVALAQAREELNKVLQEMQTSHKAKAACQLQIITKEWQCPADEVAAMPAPAKAAEKK